jgi:hypothetical protein
MTTALRIRPRSIVTHGTETATASYDDDRTAHSSSKYCRQGTATASYEFGDGNFEEGEWEDGERNELNGNLNTALPILNTVLPNLNTSVPMLSILSPVFLGMSDNFEDPFQNGSLEIIGNTDPDENPENSLHTELPRDSCERDVELPRNSNCVGTQVSYSGNVQPSSKYCSRGTETTTASNVTTHTSFCVAVGAVPFREKSKVCRAARIVSTRNGNRFKCDYAHVPFA